jgi:hypothetical protein
MSIWNVKYVKVGWKLYRNGTTKKSEKMVMKCFTEISEMSVGIINEK